MTHAAINDALRRAAGRALPGDPQASPPVGDLLGARKRRSGAPPPARVSDHAERFNASLRAEAGFLRGRFSLDDLLDG